MIIIQDKETKEQKNIYNGKEILIAIGMKFKEIHDVYINHYNDHFDIFDGETGIDHIPLFKDEKEFYDCLVNGNTELDEVNILNDKSFLDSKGRIIKIKNVYEYAKYKNRLFKPIKTISIFIGIISFIKAFIIPLIEKIIG